MVSLGSLTIMRYCCGRDLPSVNLVSVAIFQKTWLLPLGDISRVGMQVLLLIATVFLLVLPNGVLAQKTEGDHPPISQPNSFSPRPKQITSTSQAGRKQAVDLFLSTALSLRTAMVLHSDVAWPYYMMMPQTSYSTDPTYIKLRPLFWSMMFRDSIVRVADITSKSPLAFYYNPLIDVTVIAKWDQRGDRRYDLVDIIAVPGEYFDGVSPVPPASPMPRWLVNQQQGLAGELRRFTQAHLKKLAERFPVASQDDRALGKSIEFQGIKKWQEPAEQRILFHLLQLRAASHPPLKEPVERLLKNLQTADKPHILQIAEKASAPDLDALLGMDPQLRRQLELSGLYRSEDGGALLLFSLPHDGNIFLQALFKNIGPDQFRVERIGLIDLRFSVAGRQEKN